MTLRLRVISPCFLLLATACTDTGPTAGSDDELVARAEAIHDAVTTIDSHDDIPFNFASPAVDPLNADRQVNLEKMRAGGLDAAFFIVYVGQTERTPENYARAQADAMTKFDAIHRMADEMYPELIEIAYSADDVERIRSAGKLVAAIGIENGYVIGQDLALLERYHELGARYITLAHGGHNDIADSSQPRPQFGDEESEHDGISAFGAEVIEEMNRLGIMVDVSHISKGAALDAISLSWAPVIASHSNAHAVAAHYRNMDDDAMLALRDNGGVMQTVALDIFVKVPVPEKNAARDALWAEFGLAPGNGPNTLAPEQRAQYEERWAEIADRWPGATVEDFVDQIDYSVDLIGIDHVGISSDFDGGGGITGWQDAADTFNVTLELVRRGYSQAEIEQLWGGNLLRVWREVEAVAAATVN
ncbi:MAG: dipeptidase [Candidatus Rariloculaceae bacterium]